MTKIANIRSVLTLTVAALATTALIEISTVQAANANGFGDATISGGGTKKPEASTAGQKNQNGTKGTVKLPNRFGKGVKEATQANSNNGTEILPNIGSNGQPKPPLKRPSADNKPNGNTASGQGIQIGRPCEKICDTTTGAQSGAPAGGGKETFPPRGQITPPTTGDGTQSPPITSGGQTRPRLPTTGGGKTLPVRGPTTVPATGDGTQSPSGVTGGQTKPVLTPTTTVGGKTLPVAGPTTVPATGNGTQSPPIIGAGQPIKPAPKPTAGGDNGNGSGTGVLKPVLIPATGHIPQVKPMMSAENVKVVNMLKASFPLKHTLGYNNWYWNGGGYYVEVDYAKHWNTYSYPVVYVVEKEIEVCEIDYKYRLRYVPGHGYERVIVTICKLV